MVDFDFELFDEESFNMINHSAIIPEELAQYIYQLEEELENLVEVSIQKDQTIQYQASTIVGLKSIRPN